MKILVLLSIFINFSVCQKTFLDEAFLSLLRWGKQVIFELEKPSLPGPTRRNHVSIIKNQIKNPQLMDIPYFHPQNMQVPFNESMPFFCDVNGPGARSKVPPDSVHKLKPGDIDIVAAIGDSLTAANGVFSSGNDPFQVVIEGKLKIIQDSGIIRPSF